MIVKQTLLDIGLNMFGMELFAESLLKNEKVREHVRARGEPLTVSFPVRRSDCPGWAGIYITLWPVKEGETYPPPSGGIASVAASDERHVFDQWRNDFIAREGSHPEAVDAWKARAALVAGIPPAEVSDLARALIAKLDAVHPHLTNLHALAQNRGQRYSGPTYGEELEALRTAVAPSTPATDGAQHHE